MRDLNKILSVFAVAAFVILAIGFVTSSAYAQSDCDGESGAGYGLCTAYCEAMDCDGSDGGPHASQNACDTVASNYDKIVGGDLPCEGPICTAVCSIPTFCCGANCCDAQKGEICCNGTCQNSACL